MPRNWGLPAKDQHAAFINAKTAKPLLTLVVSAIFGVIGASVAAVSFTEARALAPDLFHGASLIAAVIAAGFGCWSYIWLARPRFAAQILRPGRCFFGPGAILCARCNRFVCGFNRRAKRPSADAGHYRRAAIMHIRRRRRGGGVSDGARLCSLL